MPVIKDSKASLYHVGLCRDDLRQARYAILPGDPGRVMKLAAYFDEAVELNFHREYKSALVKAGEEYVLICSTGMGGPSVAIGMEELAMLGISKFIRVGTTGTINEQIRLGDLIINTAAVRLEGTSTHYAPLEYPAVADFRLVGAMVQVAQNMGLTHHTGIGVSSDTFYPGQERYDSFTEYVPARFRGSMQEWCKLNVLNYEMENACVLTLGSVFGLQAAAVALTVAQRTQSEAPVTDQTRAAMEAQYFHYIKNLLEYCTTHSI